MENIIERLAERRIREAIERGEFDALPGTGRALRLDDNSMVPAELRAAYRLLKNAGYLPPELELRREIAGAEQLLSLALAPDERRAAGRRLAMLQLRLGAMRGRRVDLRREAEYFARLAERIDGDAAAGRRRSDGAAAQAASISRQRRL